MPAYKPTTINASLFPDGDTAEDERVEHAPGDASKVNKKRWGLKKAPKTGRTMRNLGDEGEERPDEKSPPSTQPSTRRSSLTAVNVQDTLDSDNAEKGQGSEKPKAEGLDGYDKNKIVLVQFEEGDPENPLNWSRARKWVITILLDAMTVMIGLSTTAYSSGIGSMTEEFGVANVVGQIGMTTFNATCAIAPLFLAPLCELVGRREIYLGAYLCFTLIFILLALSPNITGILIGRALSGLFGCVGTILVGGTLADIWNTRDRGLPMSTFTFSAIFGTVAAPIYCGYIDQAIGWRWIEWIHMIASGILLILEVFLLKETRGAKILAQRAKKLRKETGRNNIRAPIELENESVKDLLKTSCTKSFILLVREPTILAFGLWIAYAWFLTFLFLSAIPLAFQHTSRAWPEGNGGLPYIALVIGCFIGFGTSRWTDSIYDRKRAANNGVPVPEFRLWGAMYFAWLMPAGLFIFSFTQYGFVHWMGPMVALVLILVRSYHIFNATYNYTSDYTPENASSAIAGQGLLRNLAGAASPLFANQMFTGMGYQYAGLLLSLVASLAIPLPYLLFRYGERIRAKSKFASSNEALEKERTTDENVDERPRIAREATYSGSFV
uniref:BY PROTMAP: gi/472585063/gb/EMS22629.1/ fructose facilitator [Rhodosporidium toruloides NP11] gi/647403384/emb/CDR49512.1/ RHTO0S27e01244g1_1 [Rhodosporidium toruloides] n=1 Tax=Rhodotorula toruloides TaxID=5286 RepID=A0A0K3CJD3_RHOTO